MSMLEVKAVMSFGTYKAGRHYQVDGDDPAVQGLVLGGYFQVLNVLKEDPDELGADTDSSGLDPVPDSGVVKRKPGRPKKAVAGTEGEARDTDGTGDHLPNPSNDLHPESHHAAGTPDSQPN